MRLVNTHKNLAGPFTIHQFKDEDIPPYAILSHTWEDDEVTFQDMHSADVVNKKGYQKIQDCCSVARAQGLDYVWIDTCCIDKTSSTELSESINSMYRWYQEASVCYTYLADVETPTEISASRWFERGFTLQELIAPATVIFYSRTWSELGTKETLQDIISKRTNIPVEILSDADRVDNASVAQRMSWAANRKTSRLEDEAYCLMGLFGINMPLLYGEGKAAFIRLQEEIIRMSDDHSIFAWKAKSPGHGGLLAPSVDAFSDSGDIILTQDPRVMSKTAWTTTNKGIHLELPFVGIGHGGLGFGILPCTPRDNENLFFAIYLQDQSLTMERFERIRYHKLELLDLSFFVPFQFPFRQICIQQRRLAVTSRRTGTPPTSGTNDPRHKVKVNLKDKVGRTPLSYAIEGGHEHVVWLLITRGDILVNDRDNSDFTPLLYAAKQGSPKIINMLLAQGVSPDSMKDGSGRTVLCHASEAGHVAAVRVFLTRINLGPNVRDAANHTPLIYAAANGHEAVLLLDNGANIEAMDSRGRTPICLAADTGDEAITQFQQEVIACLLITQGANIGQCDDQGRTPLHWAVINKCRLVVAKLLARKASLETEDDQGRTPLHWAAMTGNLTITMSLLDAGANVKAEDAYRKMPIRYAKDLGDKAAIALLLKYT
ncbi:ankyrin repeat-containing domain protein [Aspergillus candidus]|uniref:Ankyrin repeat-containing domain protein n=1 Tax=Aspergillus candidus TaxID=41067 RepID=A0A2I2F8I3_ASPCN|nr:ankyrin repeat-containing domain protein [Aspergillus candidus]PLB36942.1 ankyrin repeat-containing domain protein [Aspergillus candidus]